jgi:hypothetical protein
MSSDEEKRKEIYCMFFRRFHAEEKAKQAHQPIFRVQTGALGLNRERIGGRGQSM